MANASAGAFRQDEPASNQSGVYQGSVERATYVGVEWHVVVRLGDALVGISDGHADNEPGISCRFDIDPHSIQVWPLARTKVTRNYRQRLGTQAFIPAPTLTISTSTP